MRVVCVAGTRPNFVKLKPLVDEFDRRGVPNVIVHTGQHFDSSMSDAFFHDLRLRQPDHDLGVAARPHPQQIVAVMIAIEPVLEQLRPDVTVVLGDVSSTIGAALAASSMGIPVAHVEAGLRSRDWSMPEELNRAVTDRVSRFLFAPSPEAVANLAEEGLPRERIHLVGNVMIDTLLSNLDRARARPIVRDLGLTKGRYGLVTLHRPANVDDVAVLSDLLDAMGALATELPLVMPVHPRTRRALAHVRAPAGVRLLDPIGYLDFIALEADAAIVLTDSGGVQEETTVLGIPCLTLRDTTERPATVAEGTNRVVGRNPERIVRCARRVLADGVERRRPALWDGHAAERIAAVLADSLGGAEGAPPHHPAEPSRDPNPPRSPTYH